MADVAADVAAVAAFLAADTTDVLSAAKAADGGFCPAEILMALPTGWHLDLPKTWFCD